MATKTTEYDELLKIQAMEAQRFQRLALECVEFEEWVSKGNLDWLEEKIWKPLEHELLMTIKGLDFVPNSLQQLAHIKGQLETFDTLKNRIKQKIQEGHDARQKLQDLQNSTPDRGES